MNMRDIFVRKLICNGIITGIGSDAKTKSVNILIATQDELVMPLLDCVGEPTTVEEPDISESLVAVTPRRRLHPQIHIPCGLNGKTLEDTV